MTEALDTTTPIAFIVGTETRSFSPLRPHPREYWTQKNARKPLKNYTCC